jgi:hypothetical protein
MPHNWMDFDEARAPIDDLFGFSSAPSNCPHVMPNWFELKAGAGRPLRPVRTRKAGPNTAAKPGFGVWGDWGNLA